MGSQTARELATLTNLEAALIFHFRGNHYPPLPLSLIPLALKIVKEEVGPDDEVELPQGVTYRGSKTAPVYECINAWHLQEFIYSREDYEQEG